MSSRLLSYYTSVTDCQNKALTPKTSIVHTAAALANMSFIKTSAARSGLVLTLPWLFDTTQKWRRVCVKNVMLMRRPNRHISKRRNGVDGEKRRTPPSHIVDSRPPPVTPMSLAWVGLTQKIRHPTMGCGRSAQLGKSSCSCSESRG